MFILKVTMVPILIAVVTLAGRRWGAGIAGLLAGFPVVAGPVVILVAVEQGAEFGAVASIAAMSAIAGLLAFGIAYYWASFRWSWPVALACGTAAWLLSAGALASLPSLPHVALAVAALSLILAPRLLPRGLPLPVSGAGLSDLPFRMIMGALLTILVTTVAASFGGVWAGLLAVFPVVGLVLAVFIHRAHGPHQVVLMYRGMVHGLYSFATFFLVLAVLWPRIEFWSACILAVMAGIAVKAVVQLLVWPSNRLSGDVAGGVR